MEIVVKIPDQKYKWIVNNPETYTDDLCEAVRNGIPLPEHHGRLIDSEVLGNYFWGNRSKLFEYKDLQIVIDNAPTIIEGSDSE